MRIIAFILLLISATAFPLYITAGIGLVCIFYFKNFYEVGIVFFIHDVVFGAPQTRYFDFPYVMTALSFTLVLIWSWLRTKLFRDKRF